MKTSIIQAKVERSKDFSEEIFFLKLLLETTGWLKSFESDTYNQ